MERRCIAAAEEEEEIFFSVATVRGLVRWGFGRGKGVRWRIYVRGICYCGNDSVAFPFTHADTPYLTLRSIFALKHG
jgi:hypothetical protein